MSRNRVSLVGQRFERLTVISFHLADKRGNSIWKCVCDCGNETTVNGSRLKAGTTRSCGCLQRERVFGGRRTHGMSDKSSTYNAWVGMRARCFTTTLKSYPHYGGRGITVCGRWRDSFENFYADMGERPEGTSLDRIDNDGPYSPENCRWATAYEQANNRRSNKRILYQGETQTIAQWERSLGFPKGAITSRLGVGWDFDRAVTTPFVRRTADSRPPVLSIFGGN